VETAARRHAGVGSAESGAHPIAWRSVVRGVLHSAAVCHVA